MWILQAHGQTGVAHHGRRVRGMRLGIVGAQTYIHSYIRTYKYINIHTYKYINTYTLYTYIPTYIYTYIHTYIIRTYLHIHPCIHTYIYTNIVVYTTVAMCKVVKQKPHHYHNGHNVTACLKLKSKCCCRK